jgi:hypothetical protein
MKINVHSISHMQHTVKDDWLNTKFNCHLQLIKKKNCHLQIWWGICNFQTDNLRFFLHNFLNYNFRMVTPKRLYI